MVDFQFKLPPFPHQKEEWDYSRTMASRAIFWDMGCGKTKLVVDTGAWMYDRGIIDAIFVLAPNGVHENWVTDELPKHMPDNVDWKAFTYQSNKAKTKWHQRACKEILEYPGLAIVCMSYNAFMTKKNKHWMGGLRFTRKFLDKRRVLYVADESQRIKTPGAKRTKSVIASAKYATSRRILSGTPITKDPFDIYSQLKFLDPDFWKTRGFASLEAFKTHFGIWETFEIKDEDGHVTARFEKAVAFKHLNQLHEIVMDVGSRITKEDANLGLPPKLYTKRYHELCPEQARVYKELKENFLAFLDSGEVITAPIVITQLLRLQQIICGYVTDDLDSSVLHRMAENPRLKLLTDTVEDITAGKVIIWARFREDINQIMEALGDKAVRYDGQTSQEDRLIARQRFQDAHDVDCKYFVANPAAAATGLTLTQARTVIYYSNSFDLEHRLQSEDRAHRIGQEHPVLYIDLAARGTVDTKIIWSLRNKKGIASEITGDKVRSWI